MTLLLLLAGLVVLTLGAELLVRGSSKLALSVGVSPLVVGLTIVSMGTSAPEVAVSVSAAAQGSTDLSIGNVVGSNIFNVLFILGLAALIKPLVVHRQIIRQELPVMIGSSILLLLLVLDGVLGRVEAGVLLGLLILYTVFLVRQSRAETRRNPELEDKAPATGWDRHWSVQVLLILVGLAGLVFGSDLLVEAAIDIAKSLGVSDLVIGLTIVAAGTSLPEVATSVMATIRGERDIAIGNVIGSNTFNILGCLGASGLVSNGGLEVSPQVIGFDIWVMLGVAAATLPLFITGFRITRLNGVLLLAYYVAYTVYLVLSAEAHPAVPELGRIMLSVALPATVVLFVLMMLREPWGKAEEG